MFPVNLHQNPARPLHWYPHEHTMFASKVLESCKCKVQHEAAANVLTKELIFEGATPTCQTLIPPIKNEDLDQWILACREVNAQGAQALVVALAAHLQFGSSAMSLCSNCKALGPFAKQCPKKG